MAELEADGIEAVLHDVADMDGLGYVFCADEMKSEAMNVLTTFCHSLH